MPSAGRVKGAKLLHEPTHAEGHARILSTLVESGVLHEHSEFPRYPKASL